MHFGTVFRSERPGFPPYIMPNGTYERKKYFLWGPLNLENPSVSSGATSISGSELESQEVIVSRTVKKSELNWPIKKWHFVNVNLISEGVNLPYIYIY